MKKKWYIFYSALFLIAILALLKAYFKSNDFHTYYRTAHRILNGNFNIYTLNDGQGPFWYPPFFAYIFSMFAFLSKNLAQLLWGIVNLILCLQIVRYIKNFFFSKQKLELRFWTLMLLAMIYPFLSNFLTGNVHILLLFLIIAFFTNLEKNKLTASSLFLSIAILFKVTPIVFYVYALFKQRWKFCFFFFPLSMLLLIFFPSIIIGFDENLNLYKRFIDFLPLYDQVVDLARETVQSLAAFSLRYFSHVRDGYLAVNLLDLNRETALTIGKALSIIFVTPSAILFVINYKNKFPYKNCLEFAIIMASIPFITPSAFIHTYVFMTPAAMFLINYFSTHTNSKLKYICLSGWFLFTFSPDFFLGKYINNFIESLSIPLIGATLIFIAINYLYYKTANLNKLSEQASLQQKT